MKNKDVGCVPKEKSRVPFPLKSSTAFHAKLSDSEINIPKDHKGKCVPFPVRGITVADIVLGTY